MKRAIAILALFAATGCGGTFRFVGMHDPGADSIKALAESQTAIVKALTDALSAVKPCEVPR